MKTVSCAVVLSALLPTLMSPVWTVHATTAALRRTSQTNSELGISDTKSEVYLSRVAHVRAAHCHIDKGQGHALQQQYTGTCYAKYFRQLHL